MAYGVLADVVVALHFAFVLFVLLGGLFALRRRWAAWLHLPAAAWGALISFFGWVCPLTPLENWLRRRGGEAGYSESFIEHYLLPVLYPEGMTRGVQAGLGVLVILANAAIYRAVLRRRPAAQSG